MQTNALPYASEVASLISTGGQTVRLGYIPDINTTFDFHIGGLTYANSTTLFGQSWQGAAFMIDVQSNKYYWHGRGTALDPSPTTSDLSIRHPRRQIPIASR